MNVIRSFVVAIDQVSGAAESGARNAAWIAELRAWPGRQVDCLERGRPSILRQVVVVKSETGAEHGFAVVARGIGDSNARTELPAVVMRRLRLERYLQRLQSEK